MKQSTINFVDNTSTSEAFVYVLRFQWHIIKNIAKFINKFAHRFPWVLVVVVLVVSTLISYINIGTARAERDKYNKENVQLKQQVESLQNIDEIRRGGAE
jgi:ABC-type multidrug transport system fused ATPase/permease subunit